MPLTGPAWTTNLTFGHGCHYLVEQHALRLLTHRSDTLPALSGIARYSRAKPLDRYAAGLEESQLIPSLLWKTRSPKLSTETANLQ